jgi:polysaccharide biosynthesis/export protein
MKTLLYLMLVAILGKTAAIAQVGELPLRKGDRVTISIGGIPDNEIQQIRGVYTVSDDGTIPLLYIGNVRAVGMKPSALQRSIEQAYISQEYYTRPTVVVSIDGGGEGGGITTRFVTVIGVNKPGTVPYKQSMTMSQAIFNAGGPTPFGNMKKVKLIRAGSTPTVHNLSSGLGNPSIDVQVQPDDQIIVPE